MKRYVHVMLAVIMMISMAAMAHAEQAMPTNEAKVRAFVEQLQGLYDARLIIGSPLEVNDMQLIPLATVGVGYGQHVIEGDNLDMAGTGGVLNPVGVIVVSGNNVKLLQLSKGFVEQVLGAVLPLVLQLRPLDAPSSPGSPDGQVAANATMTNSRGVLRTLLSISWRVSLFLMLGWLFLSLIIQTLFPKPVKMIVSEVTQNTVRVGLIGLLGYGIVAILMLIFTISLIGLPLTLLLGLLTCLLTIVGTVGIALLIGQKAMEALDKKELSDTIHLLVGGLILAVIGVFPILGWIVWTIISLLGFGTIVHIQWAQVKQG